VNRGRSRLEIGCYGDINVSRRRAGSYRAETRYRDWDGEVRKVTATGTSASAAKSALRHKLAQRGADSGHGQALNAESPVSALAAAWLEDVQMRTDLADGTKDVYRRELHSLVLPTFKNFLLREVTTGRVDRFLKQQALRSYARARHSRVVLNLMFNFALRHDAVVRNPVAGTGRLKRVKQQPKALTPGDVAAVRRAAREWRTGPSLSGPKPDGQVRDLVEVMLGGGGRIGEALALRKCDINDDVSPMQVTVAGTLIVVKGKPVFRQDHPKTSSSRRTVAVPEWTAEVVRRRLAGIADKPDDHLLFFTRRGTPLAPYNARRTLRKMLADAGLEHLEITPHSFRRTGATTIARASDAETAAEFLGHGSPDVTKHHYIEEEPSIVNPAPARYLETLAPHEDDHAASFRTPNNAA
jgi:integrase